MAPDAGLEVDPHQDVRFPAARGACAPPHVGDDGAERGDRAGPGATAAQALEGGDLIPGDVEDLTGDVAGLFAEGHLWGEHRDANVDDGRGAGAEKAAVVARELYRGGGLEAVAGEGGPRPHEVDGARGVTGDVVHRRADHDSTLDQGHLGASCVKKARRRF